MMPGAEALALGLKYAVGGSALFAEVLIAACLFAHGQPTRQHPIARAVAAVGLLFATELLTSFLAGTRSTADGSLVVLNIDASYPLSLGIIGGLVTCTAFLLVTIPTLLACFEMSPWAATFCSTAGYALQNLASSIGETVGLILSAAGVPGIVTGGNAWLTAISCTAVYAIAYLLFIRRIEPKGLEGRGNPAMLAMVVVVVFGIIEFDLILKYVVTGSLALPVTLCMRAFHALICVFVIIAEVELVVVRQLSSEKAAAELLLAEQERQYQLSRENIEAINIKCHDLRHQIRSLAAGEKVVDKRVLESVARDINVYDSKPHHAHLRGRWRGAGLHGTGGPLRPLWQRTRQCYRGRRAPGRCGKEVHLAHRAQARRNRDHPRGELLRPHCQCKELQRRRAGKH